MSVSNQSLEMYPVRSVPVTRPFIWLSKGWDDLWQHPLPSLAYGVLVSMMGAIILIYSRHPYFMAAAWVGFLLVGPLFTAGLCELSRSRDVGSPANFQSSLRPLSHNRQSLLKVAQTLMLLAMSWFVFCVALYSGLFGSPAPNIGSTVWGDVLRQLSSAQLMAYLATGLGLSAIVFALSVVTVPMIVERHVNAATAMRTSLRVAARDFPALMVWAALIVLLVLMGFATGLIGMVIVFPLLGHATWHAYGELVH